VAANSVLTTDDAELVAEVDWAENRSPVVPLPEQWVGMQAAFTLLPGQALRQNTVRPPQVFAVGSQVRVSTTGVGFEMSATGQALTAGQVGQPARVKLTNGKVVSGPVNKSGVVELTL
jgi:flagella basal body P-ring formation protein FlgA